jgi:hypothetical protein
MLCDVQVVGEVPSCRPADLVDTAHSYGRKGNLPYWVASGLHCRHCRRVHVFFPHIQNYKNNSPNGEKLNYHPK